MDREKLKARIVDHFKDIEEWGGGKGYRIFHSINVAETALRIAKEEKLEVDEDALYLAGISHDLRKDEVVKYGLMIYALERYKDIDSFTVGYLQNFYKDISFPKGLLEKVVEILNGIKSDNPKYVESKTLFDADELVNLGYSGIWRNFVTQSYMKHTMDQSMMHWVETEKAKQLEVADTLSFDFSKNLALKRIERCDEFFKKLKEEVENKD